MGVWQGDTPDSGGAAIMGVPLPHLVLPLSGCLSRPPRQGQHEVRQGDTGQFSTELFVDVPPSFSFLWTCRLSGVSSPYGGLAPMCLRCCVAMSGPWYTAGANGGATLLGTMVLARLCVCQSRPSNPHWLPQSVGEAPEDEGTIRLHCLVYLCRFGDRYLRPEG